MIKTLLGLKGNPRACVYTEPLWGLSMNLCLPYASVYMLGLGLNDVQVGVTASIYMFSQMLFAFLSGAITDRLGRRKTTALFDFLAWSVPCLIWAFAQGFWFFAVAALLNGMMKIPTVSWDCLLVEDAKKEDITKLYSWVVVCGNLSALFAPIASVLVSKYTLVPAVRVLYINALVVMTAKIILLFVLSRETQTGIKRKEEVRNQPFFSQLTGYMGVVKQMVNSRGTMFAVLISIIVEIAAMINSTFWQIIASRKIGLPDTMLPIFPMVRSIMGIVLFFTVISAMKQTRPKRPLLTGFVSFIIGQVLLIATPDASVVGFIFLFFSLLAESMGFAMLTIMREALVALHVDPAERSRVLAMLQMTVMLVSVPFGYIGGKLSSISRVLPFALNITLLLIGIISTLLFFGGMAKVRNRK
jgi:MFS family permease